MSLILHKVACVPYEVCHLISWRKSDFSEGKMSRLVFPFWFLWNRLLNQVSTIVCAGWGRLHASSKLLSKIALLVAEIQDLNPGCWSRKAGMLNSSDQMTSAACCCFNRLHAASYLPTSAHGKVVPYLLEIYNQRSLLLPKGSKSKNWVTWSQILECVYLVSCTVSSRPCTSFCPSVVWPLNGVSSIAKGS